MSEPFCFERTSKLPDGWFAIEWPGLTRRQEIDTEPRITNRKGALLSPPAAVDSIKGRKGAYKVRYDTRLAQLDAITALAPDLCTAIGQKLANISASNTGKRWALLHVTCSNQ